MPEDTTTANVIDGIMDSGATDPAVGYHGYLKGHTCQEARDRKQNAAAGACSQKW